MLFIVIITIIILFVLLIFTLVAFYWVSIIVSISSTQLINNIKEAPFGIPDASTENENYLRVKPIVDSDTFSVGNRPVLL